MTSPPWIRPFPALALTSSISIRNTSFTCATSSLILFLHTVLLLKSEVKRSAISTPKLLAILLRACSVNCFCLPVSRREIFAASTPIASARSAIFMFFAWRSCLTRFPMFMRLLHSTCAKYLREIICSSRNMWRLYAITITKCA